MIRTSLIRILLDFFVFNHWTTVEHVVEFFCGDSSLQETFSSL